MGEGGVDGLSVLVAEDELLLALDICDVLNRAGCHVLGPARSLASAQTLAAQKGAFDLALLDVNLGGESAIELAGHLMAAGIPVILTTGYDRPDLPESLAETRICVKPISPALLLETMRDLVVKSGKC